MVAFGVRYGGGLWPADDGTIFHSARRLEPLGPAGEVELEAERAFVGAQGHIGAQRHGVRFLAGLIAALALTDAWRSLHRPLTSSPSEHGIGLIEAASATARPQAPRMERSDRRE